MREKSERSYSVTVMFTAHGEYLRTQREVKSEVQSWLESLDATVSAVHVVRSTKKQKRGGR
jgi:hypothetical protein